MVFYVLTLLFCMLLSSVLPYGCIPTRTRSSVSVQNETFVAYTAVTSYQILTGTIIYVAEAIAVSAFINI